MLYTIYIYQQDDGALMYEKQFENISSGKMELFSGFFNALKSFISQMMIKGSNDLKNITMGEYTILVTSLNEIKADIVTIADKDDYKLVNKLIPKIIKTILSNKSIFLKWDGQSDDFKVFNEPLSEIVISEKKLVSDKTLTENPAIVLKEMWTHKESVSDQKKETLLEEREILIEKLDSLIIIPEKIAICERLLEVSEELKEAHIFLKYQTKIKLLKDEKKDVKIKLAYYLKRIQITLNEAISALENKPVKKGSYRDVYLNVFSFSAKLKLIDVDGKWQEYQNLAKKLINMDEHSSTEISEAIKTFLKMRYDVDYYIS